MKKIFAICALLVLGTSTYAQTADDKWWANIQLTTNRFEFSFFEGLFDFSSIQNAGFRIGVDRYLNKDFDLEVGFSRGTLNHENIFDASLTDVDVRAVYKLANGYILNEESKLAPFMFVGIGANWFGDVEPFYTEYSSGTYLNIPMGLGLEYKATEGASITARATYKKSISYSPNYMQYSIGVSFSLNRKKDSDGDGILDRDDNCPEEAGPEENMGCPWPDTDGDGVLDKDDACPAVAGTLNGCPDADGDGIRDSDDACPNVAGLAAFNGCPDQDGDGVQDSEDACPTVAGTLNGCPDSDGDGIRDQEDECPNVAGTLNGCPDGDKDGVKDSEDDCPETFGLVSNGGCPEVTEEVQEIIDVAVENIQFNSGSDVLRASANESIDKVIDLMNQMDFNLELKGYTDNTGNPGSNLELSRKRASAVRQYMINKGISPDRITAQGFGIANPIADNSTREGRAKNRRVELEIIYK